MQSTSVEKSLIPNEREEFDPNLHFTLCVEPSHFFMLQLYTYFCLTFNFPFSQLVMGRQNTLSWIAIKHNTLIKVNADLQFYIVFFIYFELPKPVTMAEGLYMVSLSATT